MQVRQNTYEERGPELLVVGPSAPAEAVVLLHGVRDGRPRLRAGADRYPDGIVSGIDTRNSEGLNAAGMNSLALGLSVDFSGFGDSCSDAYAV